MAVAAKPGNFCVYATVPVDMTVLIKTLNEGQFGNQPWEIQWAVAPQSFDDQAVSAIVNHHRTSPGIFNKTLFVIADRVDWATSYVLAVNLDYEGFMDALRMKAGVAGDAIPSCDILNTDWYELIGRMTGHMYPKGAFAVYASSAIVVKKQADLLENLNVGLEVRKQYSAAVCRIARGGFPSSVETEQGKDDEVDLQPIAKEHARVAKDENFDPALFVVADELDWDDYGVIIVRASEDGTVVDSCRKPVDAASEILTWVHQGLLTWDEGKAWDDDKRTIE
ncbi:hypothetical protein ACLMJK_006296 [Lecanora helva]